MHLPDDETDNKRNGAFDEKIFVRLLDSGLVLPIDFPRFHQGRMEVQVVGHDHGPHSGDSLHPRVLVAVLAPGKRHALTKA